MLFRNCPVLVRGGGDLASGVIYRLARTGFPVLVTELEQPLAIRRTVAYASAVFEEAIAVDGLTARRIVQADEAWPALRRGEVPVLVDPEVASLETFDPVVVVDARLAKVKLDTTITQAPLVIALGPGFSAGRDCHAVVETNRGHNLGRVIWEGFAEQDTGRPGNIAGRTADRVLRAPAAGHVTAAAAIGDRVREGQEVGRVGDQAVCAPFDGVLRGMIHPSVPVLAGTKIGDVDPRGEPAYCFTISEKALAIGGGVLEAIFSAPQVRTFFAQDDGKAE